MIDPTTETLISPQEATRYHPRRDGRKVDVSVVYRHMKYGCHGVILEHLRTPRLATSPEAVARFFGEVTARAAGGVQAGVPGRPRRSRRAQDVERELDRLASDRAGRLRLGRRPEAMARVAPPSRPSRDGRSHQASRVLCQTPRRPIAPPLLHRRESGPD